MRIRTYIIYFTLSSLALFSGCSTTNHAPIVAMGLNNLTTHYNAYFNSKEKLKEVFKSLETAHKDNFKEIIPVYNFTNAKEAATYKGDLETVEKKSTASLQLHNTSDYADDHFLLIGKANFLLGDYDKALQTLKYITTEYKEGVDYVREMKKKGKSVNPTKKPKKAKKPKFEKVLDEKGNLVLKKVDERPKYEVFIHEPARAEALVWLANTYTQQKAYTEAAAVIQYAKSDDNFYKNLDKNLLLAEAHNLCSEKKYKDAIVPLESFLKLTKSKKKRVRPLFMLAQINEANENYKEASFYYKKVLKSNPNYDMEFYAKIRRANMGRKGGDPSSETRRFLLAMSRDGKYKDNLDQIYYELAEIYKVENDRPNARKFFKKSTQASTKNTDQKGLSFLRLGEMDFEEEMYVSAKFNYDSAMLNISQADPNYAAYEKRTKILDKLVLNYNTIQLEDSLQKIAAMPKAAREDFLKKLAASTNKAKEKEAEAKANKAANPDNGDGNFSGNDGGAAAWYFYNSTSRMNGYNEFIKRWGRRKLEENWRRKDKAVSQNVVDTVAKSPTDSTKIIPEEKEVDASGLASNLPLSVEQKQKSNEKIVEAFYALGSVYKDDLQNYRKANSTFTEMLRRFPKNKLLVETYYQLYLTNLKLNNTPKAESYKQSIIAEFPNSKIALYLKNPAYLAELKEKESALDNYYSNLFTQYQNGQYQDIELKSKEADVQFKDNPLKSKFELLTAMTYNKQNRLDEYIQLLNKIILKYPKSAEMEAAQSMLANLNKSKLPMVDISKQTPAPIDTAQVSAPAPSIKKDSITSISAVEKPKESTKKETEIVKPKEEKVAVKDTTQKIKEVAVSKVDSPILKPYKPLSKTERMDSIIRAEKAAKNQPKKATVIPSVLKDTTQISTPKASPKDSIKVLKPAPKVVSKDTLKTTKPAPKVGVKDTVKSVIKPVAPKPTVKDSAKIVAPKVAIKDTLKVSKPAPKVVSKDTLKTTKPAPKVGVKDTVKSVIKPIVPKPTVKDSTKIVAPNVAVKDTLKVSKPAPKVLAKDTLKTTKPTPKVAVKDTVKSVIKPIVPKPTVKDSAKIVAPKVAAKDTLKVSKPAAPKVVIKDTIPTEVPKINLPNLDESDLDKIYTKNDSEIHNVVLYYTNPAFFDNNLTKKIGAFDEANFSSEKINTRGVLLDDANKLILMKPFANKMKAENYIAGLLASNSLEAIPKENFKIFSINVSNYSKLITTKKVGNYLNFYKKNNSK